MVTITFTGVSQCFHGRQIFGPLEARLSGGKITAVTGQNGSGKSTFLKLAGHLLLPSSGSVLVADDGVELHKDALRQRLAMVTPELRFYDRLTARENMDFLLGMRGMTLDEGEYRDLLERVGLVEAAVAHSYVGEFSTGMRQRLKMAVLLASGADIWLLDEPGANLDEAGRDLLAAEMRQAAARGVLMAIATNDTREEALADETISLAGG
ncbi:heme exporter protein A [Selenomonas ruminantium]|uniref:Heme exporter protein A n=1 Tax=Selenomonas ruminantium TaxID=971 RepID=A0A1M6XY75_SELRU|nr:ABC transporter ATP-binding protein [Selenomonas ruminantium]SHL10856.1 heme exporter protein A [Selenomonas ruminantium]